MNTRYAPFVLAAAMIAIGIAGRIMPHMWNTTPVTAIALFMAAYFGFRYSAAAVVAVMAISDAVIGGYQWQVMVSVYASLFAAAAIGMLIRKDARISTALPAALASSALFFLVTNWAVWQWSPLYAHTWSGLIDSYVMGLPFFRNSLIGDIFYTASFFGAFEIIHAWKPEWLPNTPRGYILGGNR